jgi:hypothetical protein
MAQKLTAELIYLTHTHVRGDRQADRHALGTHSTGAQHPTAASRRTGLAATHHIDIDGARAYGRHLAHAPLLWDEMS